jgi:IS605 OrfB family transposase
MEITKTTAYQPWAKDTFPAEQCSASFIRSNAIHQATSALAKTKPRTIVLEDLNVKGMMANRKMSRAVGDVGIYEFKRQITYKAEKYGSMVNTVSRWFPSSKTCSRLVDGWMKISI